MGYESSVFIVKDNRLKNAIFPAFCECLSSVEMYKMGHNSGFVSLFTTPIDFYFFPVGCVEKTPFSPVPIFDGNIHYTSSDKYGDPLRYADLKDVIGWLEEQIENGNDYRRLPPLLALLKAYDSPEWGDNIKVVHYGH